MTSSEVRAAAAAHMCLVSEGSETNQHQRCEKIDFDLANEKSGELQLGGGKERVPGKAGASVGARSSFTQKAQSIFKLFGPSDFLVQTVSTVYQRLFG